MHLRRIGADQAGITREVAAPDQPLGDTPADDHLEHLTQKVALTEAAMPVLREGRVVGNRSCQVETAEPAIGKVQMDLFADPP